jgi:hypothetical protein
LRRAEFLHLAAAAVGPSPATENYALYSSVLLQQTITLPIYSSHATDNYAIYSSPLTDNYAIYTVLLQQTITLYTVLLQQAITLYTVEQKGCSVGRAEFFYIWQQLL